MEKQIRRKNIMRTPHEKEKIILEYYSGGIGRNEICRKYNISTSNLRKWRMKYDSEGVKGLESNTGKKTGGTKGQGARKPKNREEELELKIMKLEIENAQLKKGYLVRGGGDQKEYVTTLDENMK